MLPVALSGGRKCFFGEIALQMLDAAHGEAKGPTATVEGEHTVRTKIQIACADVACESGR